MELSTVLAIYQANIDCKIDIVPPITTSPIIIAPIIISVMILIWLHSYCVQHSL